MTNGVAATLQLGCDAGTLISGGVSLNEAVVNAFILSDKPVPDTGAPAAWEGSVANNSGLDLIMAVYVVCATQTSTSSSAATATGPTSKETTMNTNLKLKLVGLSATIAMLALPVADAVARNWS